MIVPMTKYQLVVYHADRNAFLDRLRGLGVVDVTTSQWEPSAGDAALLSLVDRHRQAGVRLKQVAGEIDPQAMPEPFANGAEAFEAYEAAAAGYDSTATLIAKTVKEAEDAAIWGEFSPGTISALLRDGVLLRFFQTDEDGYERHRDQWEAEYVVAELIRKGGFVWFAVVTSPGADISLSAQEVKAPAAPASVKRAEIAELEERLEHYRRILERAAVSHGMIAAEGNVYAQQVQFNKVAASGEKYADGYLEVLEGWAPRDRDDEVEAFLAGCDGVVYVKSRPTPEDNTPVLLKNNRFASLFEFIGSFYTLPRYGTMDLTPYFAPFYMIYFGFCLGDGGYGLLFILAGIFLRRMSNETMRRIGGLTLWCGAATVVFGTLTGSYFGIALADLEIFAPYKDKFLTPPNLMTLAIVLGFIQILFGMALKAVSMSMQFGFRYSLPTIGWMTVIISSIVAYLMNEFGISTTAILSIPHIAFMCAGGFLMLFMNSPGKNPLVNFGNGLWNTYNDLTGLLGDILSYIRLFAIGLSGGVLAMVFNDLAMGLSGDVPVLKQIIMVLILLVGHGINLFMSTLSSFVHPMRLTFVEFFKNAGFESGERAYTPFRKE